MGELSKQPNIGTVVEAQLNDVGVTTLEQLKEIGSKQAWLKIRAIDSSACIHRLLGMEGDIGGLLKTFARELRLGQRIFQLEISARGLPDILSGSQSAHLHHSAYCC